MAALNRARVAPALVLVLEDVARLGHHAAHATGETRCHLFAEMEIHLGRLDPHHPRVAGMLAEVQRLRAQP